MARSRRSPIVTVDDLKVAFALFCSICGIGTLGMPANYARAGPVLGTVALLLMAGTNVYATVVVSKLLLLAPKSVKTYGDLGEWVLGRPGRYMVLLSQMACCLLIPCAFLVLGSLMFQVLFPNSFDQVFWIVFMAILVFPIALVPTMKEGAGMMFAGCLATIVSDVVGIGILIYNLDGHPAPPAPKFDLGQITTTFGNLSLAYGAAIIIPDLQRGHGQPRRMPRVVLATMTLISIFFLALGVSGYSVGGCQLSGNLLFSIAGDGTGKTALHFVAHRGAVVMSYLFMQIHICIAFSALLHPAFYIVERLLLGMHMEKAITEEADRMEKEYTSANTPSRGSETAEESDEEEGDDLTEYQGYRNMARYVLLRTALITVLVIASVALKDKFLDLVDFIGASAISISCIILPLVLYLKVRWNQLPLYERMIAVFLILISAAASAYVMVQTGKVLFRGAVKSDVVFPFCPAEHQMQPYYVRNSV